MKNLKLFLVSLIAITVLFSCEKEAAYDNDSLLKSKKVSTGPSSPVSDIDEVTPYIIDGENRGGNRTCAEVADFFGLYPNPFLCSEKIDYNGGFEGTFPEGLNVEVTGGTYVSFSMEDCIELPGMEGLYKVGAVIVKGSNQANVYFYGEFNEDTETWSVIGTKEDSGLSAPLNPNGKPAGLSNLTFCFIKVDNVIAVKSYYFIGEENVSSGRAVSDGNLAFPGNGYWCDTWGLGYNFYPSTKSFNMVKAGTSTVVGTVTVDVDGVVTISMNEGLILDESWVYVGTLYDLQNNDLSSDGCPLYKTYWAYNDIDGQSQVFFDD